MTFNRDSVSRHAAVVGFALRVVTTLHWLTPVQPGAEHLVHILLRKLFVVPVVLSAVWFGLRGAVVTAAITTATYLPYVFLAESNPKRNTGWWLEDLGGCAVVEALSWTIVKHLLDPCKLGFADLSKVGAFGQEHPQ